MGKVVINPILIEVAKRFKQAHTSEPDSVAAIALMIALNWRTNKEPYIPTESLLAGNFFLMPEKMVRKLHPFLKSQGHLLGQLTNHLNFFGGDYKTVLNLAKGVNDDYSLNAYTNGETWEWQDYGWPGFTFVKLNHQAINYPNIYLKLSQP